jgi:hypothetical protein
VYLPRINVQDRLKLYRAVWLEADQSALTPNEREIIPHLMNAAREMDIPYWIQEFGEPSDFLESIDDADTRSYCSINYGPWDRMFGNEPILQGFGEKPAGANYYPEDISDDEFRIASRGEHLAVSPFTMMRRTEERELVAIPYYEFFRRSVELAAEGLQRAAAITDSPQLKHFLNLRSEAITTDEYAPSEVAWLDISDSNLDILIGPTEIEDRLFGIKTAYTGTIFVRRADSELRLKWLQSHIPELQTKLPMPKPKMLHSSEVKSDLRVYDMLYAAGLDRCYLPAGVAWPADETIQSSKGIRSIVVENILRAKFEQLLQPLSDLLIEESQYKYVLPESRFLFVLLHEIAHGMGVMHVERDGATVREHLRDLHHPLEEAKANLMALWIADQLAQEGVLAKEELMPLYITCLVGLLYNIDSRQAVLQLNHFKGVGAYTRDNTSGRYSVQPKKIAQANEVLLQQILLIQAEGDYKAGRSLLKELGEPDNELALDIDRINKSELPIGIYV